MNKTSIAVKGDTGKVIMEILDNRSLKPHGLKNSLNKQVETSK